MGAKIGQRWPKYSENSGSYCNSIKSILIDYYI